MKIYQLVEYVPYEGETVYATFLGIPSKRQIIEVIQKNCGFTFEKINPVTDKLYNGGSILYHTGYIQLEELEYSVGELSDS